jgi:hypothetical protein
MDFYIVIPTIRNKYQIALNTLLQSIPDNFKNYIIIYQEEESVEINTFQDGHIEISIPNNIFEYGNWVGTGILLENKILPPDTWFLFIHDTCRMTDNTLKLTQSIIDNKGMNNELNIIWLAGGFFNICLIRKNGITAGYNLYKNHLTMDKEIAISAEHDKHHLSPKRFGVSQHFIDFNPNVGKTDDVYQTGVQRWVQYLKSIEMYKYNSCNVRIQKP